MSAEQLYTLAMVQLALVLLLASSRVKPINRDTSSLRYFQVALAFDALSWLLYLWPERIYWLMASSLAASCTIWLLLIYALSRAGRPVPWLWVLPMVALQAAVYTVLNDLALKQWSLHFMTVITALVALPSAWLFWFVKPQRTVSDCGYALVMLCWFLICIVRTLTVEIAPDWVLSGYLVSQVLWPGIMAAYGLFAITGYLEEAQQQLKAEAMQDPLTGLLNRRGLQDTLSHCLAYLARHQKPLAMLMLDLDNFKQINDLYGHDVGDKVLIKVAQQLKQALRQSDVLARLGGEEFVILLPITSAAEAAQTAERLRQLVAALHWPTPVTAHYRQTVSIGISMQTADYDIEQQMQQADQALYRAKQQGRDRLVWFAAAE